MKIWLDITAAAAAAATAIATMYLFVVLIPPMGSHMLSLCNARFPSQKKKKNTRMMTLQENTLLL